MSNQFLLIYKNEDGEFAGRMLSQSVLTKEGVFEDLYKFIKLYELGINIKKDQFYILYYSESANTYIHKPGFHCSIEPDEKELSRGMSKIAWKHFNWVEANKQEVELLYTTMCENTLRYFQRN